MRAGRVHSRALRDWLLSLASIVLLVLAIKVLDSHLGGFVSSSVGSRPDAAVLQAGEHASSFVGRAASLARDTTMGRGPLVGFTVAGVVLVIVMVKIHNR